MRKQTGFKKGMIPWNKGIKLSLEIREKMKKNRVGMLGKNHTKESKEKMRTANIGKHRSIETEYKKGCSGFLGHHSEESKRKMSEANKGKPDAKLHRIII